MQIVRICVALGLWLFCGTPVFPSQLPLFSANGPDAAAYGSAEHFPVGSAATAFEKKFMVGSFSHFDTIFPGHVVAPAAQAWEFRHASPAPEIAYVHAGNHYLLKDYLGHMPVTGLLIAKDDQILFEGYQYDRTDRDRFTSQSMTKTIVGMLAGIALPEHALGSTADTASKYIPELKDSDYGKVTVRDLLHMSSGVTCQAPQQGDGAIGLRALAQSCKQTVPEGTRFRYSAADAEVLGLIVSRAVQMPLALSAGKNLANHRHRIKGDLDDRRLRPGTSLLLFQRHAARLCSFCETAGSRRGMERKATNPGAMVIGRDHRKRLRFSARTGEVCAVFRIRISTVDLART